MNDAFGIDHPLIAVHDINALRERLIDIGFNMTSIGKHPWGTSTSLAMFQGCLLEIMGIYDQTLIDEVPAGDFHFGRHVHEHLQKREGVALTALHSTNAVADAAFAEQAGFTVSGHLEFGRDVTLPNGRLGRTKTTLALLPDTARPRLSFFLCQQHRPEFIYVPAWLVHPNSVCGYAGASVLARDADMSAMETKFAGLYGAPRPCDGGVVFDTANGKMRLLTRAAIEARNGPLPIDVLTEDAPGIVALDLAYSDGKKLEACLRNSGVIYSRHESEFRLSDPQLFGNTFLNFVPS
ncbi:VOC family protein [Marinovum sp. 2_MG-2023]|uniref:VOC family protein n=1 Tax=unclassified Marinovum TaxID=2647166 RepID=UPI0026E29FBD|nr:MULTISPECIES: VOC family protein [unclassified Marinovum]MDO6730050.1 VOC family protein [Marinovum sp. 2_MG-2023]MDO6779864.1 VOC family protein [Marinovum sp. 1_MG-2023]